MFYATENSWSADVHVTENSWCFMLQRTADQLMCMCYKCVLTCMLPKMTCVFCRKQLTGVLRKTADVCVTKSSWCVCYRKQLLYVLQKTADVFVTENSWCMCYRKQLMYVLQKTADVCFTENSSWHEAGLLQHTLHCQTTETDLQFWHPQTASLAVQQSRCQPASQVTILTHSQKNDCRRKKKKEKKSCYWLVNHALSILVRRLRKKGRMSKSVYVRVVHDLRYALRCVIERQL